jgi:hypothetical protein
MLSLKHRNSRYPKSYLFSQIYNPNLRKTLLTIFVRLTTLQYFQKYFFYLIGDGVPDICINIGYESMANSEMGGRIDNQETSMAIMSK